MQLRLTGAEGINYIAQLDHIGIIQLKSMNRYRLKLAKSFAGGGEAP